ncbi:MAG: hypothetical protein MI863_21350 [Desulfobacterales bacterium]|nr:hypothetical protein [Desulfobacterales bacterium]
MIALITKLSIIRQPFLVSISEAAKNIIRQLRHRPVLPAGHTGHGNNEIKELSIALNLMARRLGKYKTPEQDFAEDLSRHSRHLKQMNEYLVYFEESERKSIASELNGTIAQSLGLGLSKIRSLINRGNGLHQNDLMELHVFLEHAVRDIRTVMYELAPPVLDDFNVDIDPAMKSLIEEINETNRTDFRFINSMDKAVVLDTALKLTLYRATKTILSGILAQSDSPQAKVEISKQETRLLIRIHAYGPGLNAGEIMKLPANKSGAHLLPERMEQLGGSMTLRKTPRDCIIIHLTAPVSE